MLKRQEVKDSDQVKVTFIVPNDPGQGRVFLVGDFNDWQVGTNLLIKRSNDTRSVSVVLNSGQRYAFRYCTEDGAWFNDDGADAYEATELGVDNCIVTT